MGVSEVVLELLLEEQSRCPFKGRLLTLGRQDVWLNHSEVIGFAKGKGIELDTGAEVTLSDKPDQALKNWISDRCFFKMLGFSDMLSLDSSQYEGADIVFDLNSSELPSDLIDAFDVIIDIGVMEHVFDIAQAMENIHQIIKVGGRFIAFNPAVHSIDSGFYTLSPTFFHDFFKANNYIINAIKVFTFPPGYYHNVSPSKIIDYQPGMLDYAHIGVDGCYWDVFCSVTKTAKSTGYRKPRQRFYEELHQITSLCSNLDQILAQNYSLKWKLLNSLNEDEKMALITGLSMGSSTETKSKQLTNYKCKDLLKAILHKLKRRIRRIVHLGREQN